MPKMKTHKGTAKRVRKTGTGKLIRRNASGNHFNEKKSKSRKRNINMDKTIAKADEGSIKKKLGM